MKAFKTMAIIALAIFASGQVSSFAQQITVSEDELIQKAEHIYCGDKRGAVALYGRKLATSSIIADAEGPGNEREPYPETITVSSE